MAQKTFAIISSAFLLAIVTVLFLHPSHANAWDTAETHKVYIIDNGKTKAAVLEEATGKAENNHHLAYQLTLRHEGETFTSAQEHDLFQALKDIRRQLEKENIQLLCNGSKKEFWVSGMSSQMSGGRLGYLSNSNKKHSKDDLVDIFASSPDMKYASVDEQEKHREDFLQELLKNKKKNGVGDDNERTLFFIYIVIFLTFCSYLHYIWRKFGKKQKPRVIRADWYMEHLLILALLLLMLPAEPLKSQIMSSFFWPIIAVVGIGLIWVITTGLWVRLHRVYEVQQLSVQAVRRLMIESLEANGVHWNDSMATVVKESGGTVLERISIPEEELDLELYGTYIGLPNCCLVSNKRYQALIAKMKELAPDVESSA